MSGESFFNQPSKEVQEVAAITAAALLMTARDIEEMAVLRQISAAIIGYDYVPMSEQEKYDMGQGLIAVNITRITDASSLTIENINEAMGGGAESQQSAYTRELMNTIDKDDAYFAAQFTMKYQAAQDIAAEKNLPLVDVYGNDETYYEIFRRTQTPEEYAEEAAQTISHITGEVLLAARVRNIERFEDPKVLQSMSPEEIQMGIMSMQMNDELRDKMNKVAECQVEILRQMTTFMFLKIYGMDELLQLDPRLLDVIATQQEWVPGVFDAILNDNN